VHDIFSETTPLRTVPDAGSDNDYEPDVQDPFGTMVSASIGLFMLFVLFAWMFRIGAWSNRHLPESRRRSVIPFGIWLIQPEVNQLYHKLEQPNPDTDGT
jgi:hypothetical protein